MSKRTHDNKKKMEEEAPVFKIPNKEMILTRGKSIQMRRQLRNKDASPKAASKTQPPKVPKSPPKPAAKSPANKTNDRSSKGIKKVVLKPSNKLKIIEPLKLDKSVNKRKATRPQKQTNPENTAKNLSSMPSSQKCTLNSSSGSLQRSLRERCLEHKRFMDMSFAQVIRLREQTEELTDDDLLEIVQCPSPVWWEDPPDEGYSEDTSPVTSLTLQMESSSSGMKPSSCTEMIKVPKTETPSTLNVERIPDSNYDQGFVKKRSALENVLSGILTNVARSNGKVSAKLDTSKSNTVNPIKIHDLPPLEKNMDLSVIMAKQNEVVDINTSSQTTATNVAKEMRKKMLAHIPKIKNVTADCMKTIVRDKPSLSKRVYSGNDSAELIPTKLNRRLDVFIDLSEEAETDEINSNNAAETDVTHSTVLSCEENDSDSTVKLSNTVDESEVLRDLENLQIPIALPVRDNSECIVIDEDEDKNGNGQGESFLGDSESSETQPVEHFQETTIDDESNIENLKEITNTSCGESLATNEGCTKISPLSELKSPAVLLVKEQKIIAIRNENNVAKRKCCDDLENLPKRPRHFESSASKPVKDTNHTNHIGNEHSANKKEIIQPSYDSERNSNNKAENIQCLDVSDNKSEAMTLSNNNSNAIESAGYNSVSARKQSSLVISRIQQAYRELVTKFPNDYGSNKQSAQEIRRNSTSKVADERLILSSVKVQHQSEQSKDEKTKSVTLNNVADSEPNTIDNAPIKPAVQEICPSNVTDERSSVKVKSQSKQSKGGMKKSITLSNVPGSRLALETKEYAPKKSSPQEMSTSTVTVVGSSLSNVKDQTRSESEQSNHAKNSATLNNVTDSELKLETDDYATTKPFTTQEICKATDVTSTLSTVVKNQSERSQADKKKHQLSNVTDLEPTIETNEKPELVFYGPDLKSSKPIAYEVVSKTDTLNTLNKDNWNSINNREDSDNFKELDVKMTPGESEDEEYEYEQVNEICMSKEMIEDIIGVENSKEATSDAETLENIVFHGFNPKMNKKNYIIPQTANVKYCFECSSIYETAECRYCQKKRRESKLGTETEEKMYSCVKCTYTSFKKYNVDTHMVTHTDEKPFSCDRCQMNFRTKFSLKKHLIRHCCTDQNTKSAENIEAERGLDETYNASSDNQEQILTDEHEIIVIVSES